MKIDLSEFKKLSNQEKIERLWCELDGMEKDRNYWFGQAHCNYEDMRKGHGIQAVQDAFNFLKPIIGKSSRGTMRKKQKSVNCLLQWMGMWRSSKRRCATHENSERTNGTASNV